MLAPTNQTEVIPVQADGSHDLPIAWVTTTLENLLTVVRGVSFKKKDVHSEFRRGLVPILRATNIGRVLNFRDLIYVPNSYVKHEQLLNLGDIVVAASSGSRAVVGKAAPLRREWTGSFGTFCFALRPDRGLVKEYIAWFLQTHEYRARVSQISAGVNINNLRREHIEKTTIRLAPLAEQHRIVAEIEKQFTRLDASVAALKRVQANLKRYRASVLKAACEAKLVPTEAGLARSEGRDYEPADHLLERILSERRARWESQEKLRGKYKEPVPPDSSDLPELPEGWVWATADQLAFIASGQTPKGIVGIAEVSACGTPWYRVSDMNVAGNDTDMVAASSLISDSDAIRFRLHVRPTGTIIFPKRGGAIATNKKRRLSVPAAYDLNTMGMIPMDGMGDFLWWWFQTVDLGALGDGSNVPQINHDDIQGLVVPLPPLAEQHRIVAEVDRRLSVIKQAEAAVEANLTRAERLRQSILKQAFSGKLVPQDPNDEPASVLLERIRAEREAAQAAAKPKRRAKRRRAGPSPEKQPVLQEGAP